MLNPYSRVRAFFIRKYFSFFGKSSVNTERLIKLACRVSPRTFPLAVKFSKVYRSANNNFSAERIIRFYEIHESLKVDIARELFKMRSFYKVVRLFSKERHDEIEHKYGKNTVELIGDSYHALRNFERALEYYEYIINTHKAAKSSRIKSAECHYHCGNFKKSLFRLKQYIIRNGVNPRSRMLYSNLVGNQAKKQYEKKLFMENKYGLKINYKLEII
ncbi:tetratricopeptide repeat protein [Endozoicomonas sp. ALB032]|uniref:tetratricopeptide repeat protein n=1 Tax=Endozoicomonas sp. ALB032 TaxID=3403082 RepID=UPI003BB71F79